MDTFSLAVLMVVPHHNSEVSFLQRELLGSHSVILSPSTSKYPPVCARYWVLRCKEFNTVIAVRDPRVSLFPTPTLTHTTECPWLSMGLSHGVLSVPDPLWASASWWHSGYRSVRLPSLGHLPAWTLCSQEIKRTVGQGESRHSRWVKRGPHGPVKINRRQKQSPVWFLTSCVTTHNLLYMYLCCTRSHCGPDWGCGVDLL